MANFSERIKELRHKNKMTQEKLGKVIEVGRRYGLADNRQIR